MSTAIRKIAVTTPLMPPAETPAHEEATTFGRAFGERRPEVAFELEEAKPEKNSLYHFEFAKYVNTHTTDYIRMADSKAAILVTLLSANLLLLVQKAGQYIAEGHVAWRLTLVLVAVIYAMVSLGIAVNIIRPRLFRNAKQGHLFWEDISSQDKDTYAASFQTMTHTEICRELGEHNHNLAQSAIRKYRWLRITFRMAIVSVCFSALIILLTSA